MSAPTLNKGSSINEYVILKELGKGGCGVVYKAQHAYDASQPPVAIKLMHDISDIDRFTRERLIMQRVNHPNVVRLIEFGSYNGHPYIVMELIDGGSVGDVLDKRREACHTSQALPAPSGKGTPSTVVIADLPITPVFPVAEAAWIVMQATQGLRAAGVVHRDLKPANLMLKLGPGQRSPVLVPGNPGSSAMVKVADFGLAKSVTPGTDKSLTATGVIMGTPAYMSPEQCRVTKTVTIQSDIYALGIILYELMVGNPPFDGSNPLAIMNDHISTPVTYPPGFPPEVAAICSKCLAKEAGDRYRTITGLQADLGRLLGVSDIPDAESGSGTEDVPTGSKSGGWWTKLFKRGV